MHLPDEVKYMIEQYDIDVKELMNFASNNVITQDIVVNYIKEKYYPRIKEVKKLSYLRKVISSKLSDSYRTAVHVTLFKAVNAEALIASREKVSNILGVKVPLTFMLLKPLAKVLKDSIFNAEFRGEDQFIIYDDVNIAIAVQTKNGLFTPVIRRVTEKDLKTLLEEYRDIVTRAQNAKLKQKDLVGATFTVTNLGMYDVDFFTQIINPPQVAILGVGKIQERLTLTPDNGIRSIKIMYISLSFDHRIADGAEAAMFLKKLSEELENLNIETLV
ncbi:MAG: 2-oxo acid dehydrogenase subunit E2 [Sulfolobales archaeon]|nr:2-oxo acid dehydrogenase subunit E2 [Sulfolobales archaeon]